MTVSSMQRRVAPPPSPDLPPYPEQHAASAVARQVADRGANWGQVARAIRDEIDAIEEAMVRALDAQERRQANRARLDRALARDTDRGLR